MNAYLFALIFAAYIIGGIFIVLWMDRNYFDVNYCSGASGKRDIYRIFIWSFLLHFERLALCAKGCLETFKKAEP